MRQLGKLSHDPIYPQLLDASPFSLRSACFPVLSFSPPPGSPPCAENIVRVGCFAVRLCAAETARGSRGAADVVFLFAVVFNSDNGGLFAGESVRCQKRRIMRPERHDTRTSCRPEPLKAGTGLHYCTGENFVPPPDRRKKCIYFASLDRVQNYRHVFSQDPSSRPFDEDGNQAGNHAAKTRDRRTVCSRPRLPPPPPPPPQPPVPELIPLACSALRAPTKPGSE